MKQQTITIYYFPCADIPDFTQQQLAAFLDEEECARFQRMRAPVGARFAQGRLMVKSLLEALTGIPASELLFSYSDNGKPSVAVASDWRFSISHCDAALVVAIGQCNMGVDLELVTRERGKLEPPWQMPDKFMHPVSAAQVCSERTELRAERFTHIWTLMESHVKLNDSSIFHATRKLPIELVARGTITDSITTAITISDPCSWWSWRLNGGQMMLSLAARESHPSIALVEWRATGNHKPMQDSQLLTAPVDWQ